MWLSGPLRGKENLTPVVTHRIQGKCDYLCLAPNALVEKILLQLEYIEFKANMVIRASLSMPYPVQQYVLFRLGNAFIRSTAFGVGHAAIQCYPK